MVESGEISKKAGYLYANDAMEFYEFHVDDHPSFQAACNHLPFGGQLSVRKPRNQKKGMIFGQDEVIMKQFYLHLWHGPYLMVPAHWFPRTKEWD